MKKHSNPILGLIYNQGQSTEAGMMKVLGQKELILALSGVWEIHAQSFHILATHALLEFVKNDVDAKEIAAFKTGLAAIPSLLNQCFEFKTDLNKEKPVDDIEEKA